jgi:hypothetical protein
LLLLLYLHASLPLSLLYCSTHTTAANSSSSSSSSSTEHACCCCFQGLQVLLAADAELQH